MGKMFKLYIRAKYIEISLVDTALKDFLNGPEYLKNVDVINKNKEIRDISSGKANIFKGFFLSPFIGLYNSFVLLIKFKKVAILFKESREELTSSSYWEGVFSHE